MMSKNTLHPSPLRGGSPNTRESGWRRGGGNPCIKYLRCHPTLLASLPLRELSLPIKGRDKDY
jgi:hypothetical protein